MSKDVSLHKKLKEILSTHEYHSLESYQDPKIWAGMAVDERELLGALFVMQGQELLRLGDKAALKSFDLAAKVAPRSAAVFFQKGAAYSSQKKNIRCLLSACRAFAKATKLEPKHYDAWFKWAYALLLLGELKSDPEMLQESLRKFEMAYSLRLDLQGMEAADFYWRWGHCWHNIGKLSGEAIDISQALKYYEKAKSLGLETADFWIDYGNALAEQACLMGRDEIFNEVAELYLKAIELNPKNFEAWLNLGCSYTRLYEHDFEEVIFVKANEAFEQASRMFSKNFSLWMCWGQLFLTSGKFNRNQERLMESILKYQEAYGCEPNHPSALCRLGEAYMNLGALEESYELLCKGEEKVAQSLKIEPDNPESWYFYGRCLSEMGRYFGDVKYYFQAIEKYQYGFSLNNNLRLFHYGMALAFYEVAELTEDNASLKQALKHYSALADGEGNNLPTLFWIDWGTALMKYGENTQQKHYLEAALKKFEEAMVLLGEEIEKDSLLMECLYRYACVLDTLGDFNDDPEFYEKAIELLKQLLAVDPNHANARYNLALALAHFGELTPDVESLKKACQHFDILTREDAEDEAAWNDWGVTLLNLANLVFDPSRPYENEQLYVQAESKLQHAVALGNVHAFYNLAGYYSLVGNEQGAMHYLEKAYHAHALPQLDEILHDDWLAPLRETEEFRIFLARLMRDKKAN